MNKTQTREEIVESKGTYYESRATARLRNWPHNPRTEDEYEDIPELMENLRQHGQDDAIHVWETPEADWVLKGNRRTVAIKELGWLECKQVVHRCKDEVEAMDICLRDHGHSVALNPSEKIKAAENALRMGMGVDRTAAALGVDQSRVQLWFQLGEILPWRARNALADGDLSMNTAQHLLEVEKEDLAAAVQLVLCDPVTNEPMSHGAAVAAIDAQFVKPAQWRRAWQELEIKLKKKERRVIDGYHYVPWDQRLDYVLGETGQPEPSYEFAEDYVPRDPQGRTWGAKAKDLGVPVYVVPAPRHEDKHVCVVSARMVRDAEAVKSGEQAAESGGQEESGEGSIGDESRKLKAESSGGEEVGTGRRGDAEGEMADVLSGAMTKALLGAIFEKLVEKPAAVMTSDVWLPLWPFLARLVTDVDSGACEAWLGKLDKDGLIEKATADKKQRAPMRWAFLMLLCAESDASDGFESLHGLMEEVATHLGIKVKSLKARVEKALK